MYNEFNAYAVTYHIWIILKFNKFIMHNRLCAYKKIYIIIFIIFFVVSNISYNNSN